MLRDLRTDSLVLASPLCICMCCKHLLHGVRVACHNRIFQHAFVFAAKIFFMNFRRLRRKTSVGEWGGLAWNSHTCQICIPRVDIDRPNRSVAAWMWMWLYEYTWDYSFILRYRCGGRETQVINERHRIRNGDVVVDIPYTMKDMGAGREWQNAYDA